MPGKNSLRKTRKRELSVALSKGSNIIKRSPTKFKWTINTKEKDGENKEIVPEAKATDGLEMVENFKGIFI